MANLTEREKEDVLNRLNRHFGGNNMLNNDVLVCFQPLFY